MSSCRTWLSLSFGFGLAALAACVGDSPAFGPASGASSSSGDASTSAPDGTTSSSSGSTSGGSTSSGGQDDDGGDAAVGPPCDLTKPFSTVTALAGLSTGNEEHDIWVSADELTAYLSVSAPAHGTKKLRKSVRASRELDFPEAQDTSELDAVNAVSNGSVWSPSLGNDQLAIFTQSNGSAPGIHVAFRTSLDAPFGTPVEVRGRGSVLNSAYGDVFLAPNGSTLFLASGSSSSALAITERKRDLAQTYGDGGLEDFVPSESHASVNGVEGDSNQRPVSDLDGLVLVFASNRQPAAGSNLDMYEVRRAGIDGEFSAAVRLADPVSSVAADRPGSISGDGCSLYFTSDRPGGAGSFDAYVARRAR